MATHGPEQRSDDDRSAHYAKDSLSLIGAVSMGTGVMIGAGIFALTGQVAELAGEGFPHAFLAAALVSAFSAYSCARVRELGSDQRRRGHVSGGAMRADFAPRYP